MPIRLAGVRAQCPARACPRAWMRANDALIKGERRSRRERLAPESVALLRRVAARQIALVLGGFSALRMVRRLVRLSLTPVCATFSVAPAAAVVSSV